MKKTRKCIFHANRCISLKTPTGKIILSERNRIKNQIFCNNYLNKTNKSDSTYCIQSDNKRCVRTESKHPFPQRSHLNTKKISKDSIETTLYHQYGGKHGSVYPMGFWYAIGDSWVSSEGGLLSYLGPHIHQINFNKNSICKFDGNPNINKIIIINTLTDLIKFQNKYGTTPNVRIGRIRWDLISKDYSGIEFKNYLKLSNEIKFNTNKNNCNKFFWFLVLGCDCGCIWNKNIIKSINHVGYYKP
tara:strand:+ start:1096 stop:1830 length:735 start_codon:yes stop_codon:yes gene_type:complete